MKGLGRLKKYYQKINDYTNPKAVILMYHRVVELVDYAYQISVAPERFRQQMEFLREGFHLIGLEELAEAVRDTSIPRRAVAVTFDDGYADNYLNALPILEDFQIPATIFVSSGYVDSDREYWWDDLERIFLSTGIVPEHLEVYIDGQNYSWNLENIDQRRSVRKEIHRLMKPLFPGDREQLLETLTQWAGLGRQGRMKHRSLTCDELRRLARSPWIQIGGHTISHPQLAALPVKSQYYEIMQDHEQLEKITGKPVKTFSYPFGGRDDFSVDTVKIVKGAGFKAACSTPHTRVVRDADIYRLPRYWVGDWDINEFQIQIAEYFQR
jgi:peptidoglycan/xylan/chitin deacetylase (PgdA/CDA1 family)